MAAEKEEAAAAAEKLGGQWPQTEKAKEEGDGVEVVEEEEMAAAEEVVMAEVVAAEVEKEGTTVEAVGKAGRLAQAMSYAQAAGAVATSGDKAAYRLSPLPLDRSDGLAPPPVRGLQNHGNACYLNCVLQVVVVVVVVAI